MGNVMNDWLAQRFPEVDARTFYRYIFPAGELDKKDAFTKGKYTGIICRVDKEWDEQEQKFKPKNRRFTLTDDLDEVDAAVQTDDFCICRPLSYVGKAATAEHARMLYALAVDLDKLRYVNGQPMGLMNLWNRHVVALKLIPYPTFIVSSGTGLHLYYVMEKPIPLYKNIAAELSKYKRALTRLIWDGTITAIDRYSDIQQESIYQGFRMPGTITKDGGRVRAFLTGERVTLEYLNGFVESKDRANTAAAQQKRSGLSLAEAAEKWPDWYDSRVVRGEPRGMWATSRNLYEWWLREIPTKARAGHRYYCCMMLAIYAKKCSKYDEKKNPNPVTREELERDMFGLLEVMDAKTETPDNHFGLDDIQSALEAFDDRNVRYPRAKVEELSGIYIPAKKRNGQTQADHLEEARAIRDIRAERRGEPWDAHNGRKSQYETVQAWRAANPGGRKADCIRETGLSQPTVYKHWNPAGAAASSAEAAGKAYSEQERKKQLSAKTKEAQGILNELKYTREKSLEMLRELEKMKDSMQDDESKAAWKELYETNMNTLRLLDKMGLE